MEQAATKLTNGEFGILGVVLAIFVGGFGFLLKEILKDKKETRDDMKIFFTDFQATQVKIMNEVADIASSMKSLVTEIQHDRTTPARRG